jgi:hypothetical protein
MIKSLRPLAGVGVISLCGVDQVRSIDSQLAKSHVAEVDQLEVGP